MKVVPKCHGSGHWSKAIRCAKVSKCCHPWMVSVVLRWQLRDRAEAAGWAATPLGLDDLKRDTSSALKKLAKGNFIENFVLAA